MKDGYYSRYYRTGDKEAHCAFNVLSLGFNRCIAKLDYTQFLRRHPSKHRFSERNGRTLQSVVLVHITSGHGKFRSKPSGEITVSANSLFFVFPGVNHFYRYDDATGWNEEWLEMSPESVLPMLERAGITPASPLRTFNSVPAVAEAFQELFDLSRQEGSGTKLLVDALAHRVIAECVREWERGAARGSCDAVEKMRQSLVSNLATGVNIREASIAAGKCPSRMRDLFKRATGLSPKKYQMRSRLVRAGKLLRETNLQISEIAEQIGFESIFSFSKRFKKLLGCSPSEYRRKKAAL